MLNLNTKQDYLNYLTVQPEKTKKDLLCFKQIEKDFRHIFNTFFFWWFAFFKFEDAIYFFFLFLILCHKFIPLFCVAKLSPIKRLVFCAIIWMKNNFLWLLNFFSGLFLWKSFCREFHLFKNWICPIFCINSVFKNFWKVEFRNA